MGYIHMYVRKEKLVKTHVYGVAMSNLLAAQDQKGKRANNIDEFLVGGLQQESTCDMHG